MTYNNFPSNGSIGLPTAGFASRGKASQLKRLSVNAPRTINENQVEGVSTPRTARGHLLAGLRTAPKTPGAIPASAPFHQTQHSVGHEQSRYAQGNGNNANAGVYGRSGHQTASAATFAAAGYNQYGANVMYGKQQMYPMMEQPLALPNLNLNGQDLNQMEPEVLVEMMRLEQQRKLLEQQIQLISLQAHHAQGLTFNPLLQQQYPATPLSPNASTMLALANARNSMTVEEALAQEAGYYMYGQTNQYNNYAAGAQQQLSNSPPPPTPGFSTTPPTENAPAFRAQVSPPTETANPFERRTPSPPKCTPSPARDVAPLPPSSSNAWRRGHKKVSSLAFNSSAADLVGDGPKSALPRTIGTPQTPVTGTFGPGQGRAGEHPIRQPRGPPSMDELVAAPTAKHEGSKNFAARQRRGALSKLVRAGLERRGARTGSPGSMTPVSETEAVFSLAGSDNDSDSGRSLSGRLSIGSLRAQASGAIGSERKGRKERSRDRVESQSSISSTDSAKEESGERRRMPMLVLTKAEQRKSTLF